MEAFDLLLAFNQVNRVGLIVVVDVLEGEAEDVDAYAVGAEPVQLLNLPQFAHY